MNSGERYYRIAPTFDDHKSFFDHAWADSFLGEAEKYKLPDIAMDLCEAWKGAANAARSPWLLVTSLVSMADGFNLRKPYPIGFLCALVDHLNSGIEPPLMVNQILSMRAKVQRLDEDMTTALKQDPFKLKES